MVIGLLIFMIILLLGTFILNKMNKNKPELLTNLKGKLMWGPFLRPIYEGYLR